MTHPEGIYAPPIAEQATAAQEGVFFDDGTINEGFLVQKFGIGEAEASQEINFGPWQGTVAMMLADPKCPVSDTVSRAYSEGGLEAVVQEFKQLQRYVPSFELVISEATLQREQDRQQLGEKLKKK